MYTVYSESRNVSVQEKPLTLRNTRSGTVWSVRQSHWTHEWDASHGAICITVLIQTHSKIVSLKHVRYIDQAVKFSVDLRNSAVSPVFLVIFEISANLRRSWKVWLGGGGISQNILGPQVWFTYQNLQMFANISRAVDLRHIFNLRPPGGSITVFSSLCYILTVHHETFITLFSGPRLYSFTIEILTGSTIIKNYCHYLRYTWFTPPLVPLRETSKIWSCPQILFQIQFKFKETNIVTVYQLDIWVIVFDLQC